MLVYCRTPNGVLHLHGYRIYGRQTGHDPCSVPYRFYKTYLDALEDATIREGVLSKAFNKPFPEIAFKYSEIKFLPIETINILGNLVVDTYKDTWHSQRKIWYIKEALRNGLETV